MKNGLEHMHRKFSFYSNTAVNQLTISAFYREMLDELSSVQMLGQARQFLENFDWTNDDALRDFASVNINGVHSFGCGSEVNILNDMSMYTTV